MYNTIIIFLLFSFFLLLLCGVISYRLNFVDVPNERKIHSKPTAYTGGLALSASYLVALQLFNILDSNLNLILSISSLIMFVGFIDDKYNLNTGGKLSLQILPIFYLIVVENLKLTDIGDYYYFHWLLNSIEIPFTLICVLFLINAFNYFDGIDGSLSFCFISVLIILYFLGNNESVRLFLLILGLPIFVYLFFNFGLFNLPKLFLGDSGSLLLGFIISFTLIYFAKMKIAHPILLAWSVSIFVFEFLSINLQRIKNNKNPFKAGLDHLHHYIFNKTNSIFLTNFLLSIINIIFFIIGYIAFKFSSSIVSLLLFIVFFIVYFIWRNVSIYEKN